LEVVTLEKDGRCRWLEKRVLDKLIPQMVMASVKKSEKTMCVIEDWISNDGGKVGVDVNWLHQLGIPVVQTYKDVPSDYVVVNTGYDSIVHEEKEIRDRGIEIIDEPCPYIRKIRKIFEDIDANYQYVLLCERNHIIIKNYSSLFPKDMILIQLNNYRELIHIRQNGKPLFLVPYVTFLDKHVDAVFNFINMEYPERSNRSVRTGCMWISGPASPIVEIMNLSDDKLLGIREALLITSPGSVNKSVISLIETLEDKGLTVTPISGLKQYMDYEKTHGDSKVLLVRSPIPNNAEKPIMKYINSG